MNKNLMEMNVVVAEELKGGNEMKLEKYVGFAMGENNEDAVLMSLEEELARLKEEYNRLVESTEATKEEIEKLENEKRDEVILVGLKDELLEVFDAIEHNPYSMAFSGGVIAMAAITADNRKVLIYDDHFLNLDAETRRFVLLHEKAHIVNGDLDDVITGDKTGLIRSDKIEFAADAYAAEFVGKKEAIRSLMNVAAVVMDQDNGSIFFGELVNESVAEIRRRCQKIAGVKLEEKKVGNVVNKLINNTKGFFGLGVAIGAPNSVVVEVEENEGGNEMSNEKVEALVLYNKVSKDDLLWLDGEGFANEKGGEGDSAIFALNRHMWSLKQAGAQDFHDAKYLTTEELEAVLPYALENMESSYAKTLLSKEVPVIDGRQGVDIEFGGQGSMVVYASTVPVREGEKVDRAGLIEFKPGFITVGGKRQGNNGVVSAKSSYYELVSSYGLKLESFVKETEAGLVYNAKKAGTRVKLANSAGAMVPLFDGYYFKALVHKSYTFFNETVQSDIYVLEDANNHLLRLEFMPEDFTVKMAITTHGPVFEGEAVDFKEFELVAEKPATDGTAFFAPELMSRVGIKHSFTFRFAQLTKGLGQIVPELKERTNSDVIFFGGSVKASIDAYIKENQLEFFVLQSARTHDAGRLALGRQAAIRALSPEVFEEAHAFTSNMIDNVMNLDLDSVDKFLSLGTSLDEEALEEMGGDEIQVVHLYQENKEAFLQEGTMRNRLRTFLMKQLEKFINGNKVVLEDAVWRHMVTDPFAIMNFVSQGQLSVDMTADAGLESSVGLRQGQVLTTYKNRVLDTGLVLYRFPFLHNLEAQRVNIEKGLFVNTEAQAYYNRYKSAFKGMAVYSMWDMIAEGQSGADFDGDTTIVTFNERVVETTEKANYFLDYSKVNGEVVGGAPFGDSKPVDYNFFNKEDDALIAQEGITFDNDGVFTVKNLNKDTQELLWKATAAIGMQTLEPNYVGLLTYASDTVIEYNTVAQLPELDRLSMYLTVAVRWEIDKAKHGGEFYDALPFLRAIVEGVETMEELEAMEARYNIVLTPFFSYNKHADNFVFTLSRTIYMGETGPSNMLEIPSTEYKFLVGHESRVNNHLENIANTETSHEFHLVSHARTIVNNALRTGAINEKTVQFFDFKLISDLVTKNKVTAKHPLALLIRVTRRLGELSQMKQQEDFVVEAEQEMAVVRKSAFKFVEALEFEVSDEVIFALMYLSIAEDQFRIAKLSNRQGAFRMSYISSLFSFFGKQALAFLGAVKDVEKVAGEGNARFILKGEGELPEEFVLSLGQVVGTNYTVSLEHALQGINNGFFKVVNTKQYKNGLLVEGYFFN